MASVGIEGRSFTPAASAMAEATCDTRMLPSSIRAVSTQWGASGPRSSPTTRRTTASVAEVVNRIPTRASR